MNYTNKTHSGFVLRTFQLGLVSNYAVTTDEPNQVVLDNRTSSLDQQELISFRRKKLATVNTDLNIQNPAKVRSGVSYSAQIEETIVEESEALGRQDHPVKMYLTVIHDLSGAITDDVLDETFQRLVSSLPRQDGIIRFTDLARGALRPLADTPEV